MKVIDNLLFDDNGVQVEFKLTPNHGGKKKSFSYGIVHFDGAPNATAALSWMLSKESKVSAELWIGRDGKIVQLLSFDLIAYHAGASAWGGLIGLNSHSIGIELQNTGGQQYTDIQIETLVKVCRALNEAYKLKEWVGHDQIATPKGRKVDPGKMFPWDSFRKAVYHDANTTQAEIGVYTTTSDLNLRKGAGTSFDVLETLKKGTDVRVIDVHGEWSHVYAVGDDNVGYVASKYLTKK